MEQQHQDSSIVKEFFSGLALKQNRKDFFGTLFLSYAIIALGFIGLSSFLEKQSKVIIIVPMAPLEENSSKAVEI